ncbi:hypothetical protein ACQ5SO_07570 [Rhodovulum sp. DZ06]|uniref:hypothetical protein n=1 Tax=Rhodovulum sp. DZ06 TaxID=3425126 RepID=UPI003D342D7A
MSRVSGGVLRALIVLLVLFAPAVLVPAVSQSAREVSAVIGAIAGVCVFFEYAARNPGLIDFRFAPPYNRARFATFTAVLFLMIFFMRAQEGRDDFSAQILTTSLSLGQQLDFAMSPVSMVADMVGDPRAPTLNAVLRAAAALAFVTATVGALFFGVLFWVTPWPTDRANFNLWVNLPTLETAYGVEVERRLMRLGLAMMLAGIGAPYASLAIASRASGVVDPLAFIDPLPMVWAATVWACAPMFLFLRGAAILKVAWLIRRAR